MEEPNLNLGLTEALFVMVISFAVLAKCADWLVDGAVGMARRLRVSPIWIGIVVVSMGTTAPELAVSIQAAMQGNGDISLGNAVGSVIYDDGLALPLVAFFSPTVVLIDRHVVRSAGIFLICVDLIAYVLAFDGALVRWEGAILVLGFLVYLGFTFWEQKRKRGATVEEQGEEVSERAWTGILALLAVGLGGVLLSSRGIVESAPVVATALSVSDTIIALVVVALGTSVPEIATCFVAARRGQGGLAVGNILGADILNICWIAGASAVVQDLNVDSESIHFMFPTMLIMVFTMLALFRMGYRFERWKGVVLLTLCIVYLIALWIYRPGALHTH